MNIQILRGRCSAISHEGKFRSFPFCFYSVSLFMFPLWPLIFNHWACTVYVKSSGASEPFIFDMWTSRDYQMGFLNMLCVENSQWIRQDYTGEAKNWKHNIQTSISKYFMSKAKSLIAFSLAPKLTLFHTQSWFLYHNYDCVSRNCKAIAEKKQVHDSPNCSGDQWPFYRSSTLRSDNVNKGCFLKGSWMTTVSVRAHKISYNLLFLYF